MPGVFVNAERTSSVPARADTSWIHIKSIKVMWTHACTLDTHMHVQNSSSLPNTHTHKTHMQMQSICEDALRQTLGLTTTGTSSASDSVLHLWLTDSYVCAALELTATEE
jgi:hypothetical protein